LPSALRSENKERLWGANKPIDNQSEWENWQINAEYTLLREFYKIANNNGLKVPYIKSIRDNYVDIFPSEFFLLNSGNKWIMKDIEELAALAQHYGCLTRLLDWTYDIYVALYFASIGAAKRGLNKGFNNDDNIVIWALNAQHIQFLQKTTSRIPLNFVVPSYYSNSNINAQKGVLSYWEIEMESMLDIKNLFKTQRIVDRTPLDKLLQKYCSDNKDKHITLLYSFEFPASDCIEVLKVIKEMGYGASRIFPGYNGVARQIEEEILIGKYEKGVNTK
jgi:hypothetical protein